MASCAGYESWIFSQGFLQENMPKKIHRAIKKAGVFVSNRSPITTLTYKWEHWQKIWWLYALIYHLLKISADERYFERSFYWSINPNFITKRYIYIYKSVLIIKLLKVVKINYCKNTFLHRFIWTPLYKSLTATLYLVEQWAENSGVLLKPNWLETKLVKDSYSWFERHNNLIIVRHNSLIIVKKIVKMR